MTLADLIQVLDAFREAIGGDTPIAITLPNGERVEIFSVSLAPAEEGRPPLLTIDTDL